MTQRDHTITRLATLLFGGCLVIAGFLNPLPSAAENVLNISEKVSTSAASFLIDAPDQFLPVAEAYRLIPSIVNDQLIINWSIAPGYYLYKHRFGIASVNGQGVTSPLTLQYQPGEKVYDEYYGKELEVYYDSTQIGTALPGDSANNLILTVESQGCADAGLCYPPRSQTLSLNLVTGTVEEINSPPDIQTTTGAGEIRAPGLENYNLAIILLFALAGGLILNLMPCVFPVLSIKVMATTSAHLGTHSNHLHAIAYSAGIISSFIAIAIAILLLKAAGHSVGWGFQLQSPTFVALLAYLLFVIGQIFSGQLMISGGWMNLGQNKIIRNNLSGSFLTGVLATVVASPCTAPFMGTALGVALLQPAAVSLAIFAVLGFGMALPFLLLSWIPGLMEKLPAPGPWMNTFSQFLAFPLYGSVIWLLWVLGRQTSIDHAIVVSLGILLLAFAIWFHKHIKYKIARIASILLVTGLLGLSIAPGSERAEQSWQPYSPQRLAELQSAGKAVFINLTADWCITCLANEKIALSSTEFKVALNTLDISYLKGDWTNRDADITAILKQHGRTGVPLYIYYDNKGSPARILPQLLTKNMVLRVFEDSKLN